MRWSYDDLPMYYFGSAHQIKHRWAAQSSDIQLGFESLIIGMVNKFIRTLMRQRIAMVTDKEQSGNQRGVCTWWLKGYWSLMFLWLEFSCQRVFFPCLRFKSNFCVHKPLCIQKPSLVWCECERVLCVYVYIQHISEKMWLIWIL